jgi:ABC-type amino acid transport substrate-binding protein
MMLQKGIADAVLSVSYNAEREGVLRYTDDQRRAATEGMAPENYLWMSEYVFFVKKKFEDLFKFESLEQIQRDGCRVGTNKDYSYSPKFREVVDRSRVYPHTRAGMAALVAEEIDLYPMDRTVGMAVLVEMGLADSVTPLPCVIFRKPYLAGFSRLSDYPNLEEVMTRFYEELRRLRDDGTLRRIADEHMMRLLPPVNGP